MTEKNLERLKRKSRPLWTGYKPKKEATKQERLQKAEKKHKRRNEDENRKD